MSDKYEKFVEWYLRFNGYFTINNFVIHAANDSSRIFKENIGNYSDVDVLGIRMPFSKEETGVLQIQNHNKLIDGLDAKIDVVISEVKSGKSNAPNKIWKSQSDTLPIEYILSFVGIHEDLSKIKAISKELLKEFNYEDKYCRLRYIMFTRKPNNHWKSQGVNYINFEEIIRFLVEVRGECWVNEDLGEKSVHQQWDKLINDIFNVANNHILDTEEKIEKISNVLTQAV